MFIRLLAAILLAWSTQLAGASNSNYWQRPACSLRNPILNQSLVKTNNRLQVETPIDHDDDEVLRALKYRPESELPELKSSHIEDDKALLDAGYKIISDPDALHERYKISDIGLMSFVGMIQAMCYNSMFTQRYDNYDYLRLAAGPAVNNDQCISQLKNLVARAELQAIEKYSSKDVNFYQLMDTWGHVPSGLLLGNAFMEGMYHECQRLKIELPGGERAPTRYCIITAKHKSWPKIDRHDIVGTRTGICIPKACDSTISKNKADLLMTLLEHQLRHLEQGQIKFNSLYCLPDEDSPLRSILNSPKAAATLAFVICWISLLVYCTYMHYRLGSSSSPGNKSFGLTNITADSGKADKQEEEKTAADKRPRHSVHLKVYEMLSITNNIKRLFSTDKPSSLIDQGKRSEGQEDAVDENNNCVTASPIKAAKIIDFSCVEGIKVISMVYIIMGHVLMCLPTIMANGRELSGQTSLAFFLANLPPAFAVNAFFTITGTLTCYMMLKQNQSHKFITKPLTWTAFFAYRYLRIMPMYALVVLYCKTLARYAGSGPLWDYGTSSLSQRRTCELESWGVTLLFKSNYAPPLTLCIPGGWYLSNDFQFFLVTPLFLALLHKRPQLGQALLYLCIAAGYLAGFWSISSTNVSDVRPIARFEPHGFKTYVSHFSHNYTRPQYRIPAYLIGLLIGYKLFQFERAKLDYLEAKRQQQLARDSSSELIQEPDWSPLFKKYSIPTSLLLVVLCSATPFISFMLPFTRWSAHFMTSLIMPSYHVLFAIAVGFYLLMATTGSGNAGLNSFLAARFWKPLSRLSLCAVLVNVEVINYIIQSNSNLYYISNQYHAAMNCICILATYMVSIAVCVLFEAPIRAVLNSLLTYTIKRVSVPTKAQKSAKHQS